jgi:CelD/BcsL family acetyltransferase involved in cellulose biosynthesis
MHIDVVLEAPPPTEVLAAWWRELESRSDATFYTTWSWIGSWLAILPADLQPKVLLARQGNRLVGMGLVVQGRASLLRSIPVKCWRLHATGVDEFDGLTIEYNGFLAQRELATQIKRAMLHFLLYKTGVRRLEVSKADRHFSDLAQSMPANVLVRSMASTSYLVDLDKVRQAGGNYLSLLSANTRAQVKRSFSAYRELGPLVLEQASSLAQAKAFLSALRDFHGRTWAQRGVQSGFCHSAMVQDFHEVLIDQAFARGEIQMLRVAAGDTDLGYLYNFVHRGRVVFYQSGFNYGVLAKQDRPGLVCHTQAVEHNVQLGQQLYDFAAGDYRYKASLATHCEPQGSHILQRDGLLPRLDGQLRDWKQHLRNWRTRGVAVAWSTVTTLGLSKLGSECAEWLSCVPAWA